MKKYLCMIFGLFYLVGFPILAYYDNLINFVDNTSIWLFFLMYLGILYLFFTIFKSLRFEIKVLSSYIKKYRKKDDIVLFDYKDIDDAEGSKQHFYKVLINLMTEEVNVLYKNVQIIEPKLQNLYRKIERTSLRMILLYFTIRHFLGASISEIDLAQVSSNNQKIIDDFKACISKEKYLMIDINSIDEESLLKLISMFQDDLNQLSSYIKMSEYTDVTNRMNSIYSEFNQINNSIREIRPYIDNVYNNILDIKNLLSPEKENNISKECKEYNKSLDDKIIDQMLKKKLV